MDCTEDRQGDEARPPEGVAGLAEVAEHETAEQGLSASPFSTIAPTNSPSQSGFRLNGTPVAAEYNGKNVSMTRVMITAANMAPGLGRP